MNLKYFIERILEELNDAKEYMTNAIEVKAMSAEWGKWFMEMASDEMIHASNLYNMLQQYYNAQSAYYTDHGKDIPSSMSGAYKKITDHYLDCSTKLKSMKEMY